MDKVYTPGQMAEDMKEIIETIKNMGKAHILGLTVESILANGKTTKDMVEELM